VPCGPVNTLDEAFAFADRSASAASSSCRRGARQVADPIVLGATPVSYRQRPRLDATALRSAPWLRRHLSRP